MKKKRMYDVAFGDSRTCKCGHDYYYHFNPKTGEHYGCIFSYNCDCEEFQEKMLRPCCAPTGCKAHTGC